MSPVAAGGSPYTLLLLGGVLLSAYIWSRLLRRRGDDRDERLVVVYVGALLGAFVGAQAVYLLAEGWPEAGWRGAVAGKSILGALLGGYGAVELVKSWLGYRRATGDLFATVVPISLVLGRLGCTLHGCCLGAPRAPAWWTLEDAAGVARWPAAPVELAFNAAFAGAAVLLARCRRLEGQLFHVYLIAYGLFRFAHEFVRDTPRLLGPFSGYHLAALAVAWLGAARYRARRRAGYGGGTSLPQR